MKIKIKQCKSCGAIMQPKNNKKNCSVCANETILKEKKEIKKVMRKKLQDFEEKLKNISFYGAVVG